MQSPATFLIIFSSLFCISVLGYTYEQLNNQNSSLLNDIEEYSILDCKFLCLPITNKPKVVYTLYTRANENGEIINEMDSNSIEKSNFNPEHPTRFIMHGWTDDSNGNLNSLMRTTFLTKGEFNVFFIDWRSCSKLIYFQSRCCVATIGRQVAEFIDFLNTKHSLNLDTLTLIGESLGAHGVGNAGRNMKNGKAHTIVGLDPAGPCYVFDDAIEDRLRNTDAEYVETIHTNGAFYGFYEPIGDAAFYPNWGLMQNGCGHTIRKHLCSHVLASAYYSEAILRNSFAPVKCSSFGALKNGVCNIQAEDGVRMGNPENYGKANGIYYLATNRKSPYGMAGK